MLEEWKPVVGYEGLYSVSNLGRVRSEERDKRSNWGQIVTLKERMLGLHLNQHGYQRAALTKSAKTKHFFVHRLVAQAFVPNPENKPNINHIDNNPLNNKLSNLEWCTQKENMAHCTAQGRLDNHVHIILKPIDPKILEEASLLIAQGLPYKKVAELVGCGRTTIYRHFPPNKRSSEAL